MSAGIQPIFVATPKQTSARIAAANVSADGSGVLVTIFTAGTNGSRVDSITFTSSQATVGASVLKVMRVFVSDNAGANPRIRSEVLLALITRSNTVIGATSTITYTNGMVLESGQIVYATQSLCATAADNTDVFVQAGNY